MESLPLGIFKTQLNKLLKNFEVSPALRRRLEHMASRGHFHSNNLVTLLEKAMLVALLQGENRLC